MRPGGPRCLPRQLSIEDLGALLSAKAEIKVSGYPKGSRQSGVNGSFINRTLIKPFNPWKTHGAISRTGAVANFSLPQMPLGDAKCKR